MAVVWAFLGFILLSINVAQADEMRQAYWSDRPMGHVSLPTLGTGEGESYHFHKQSPQSQLSGLELQDSAEFLAEQLRSQHEEILSFRAGEFPGCSRGANYVRSLRVSGQYEQCLERAKSCEGQIAVSEGARDLVFQGALCAWNTFDYERARQMFGRVTSPAAKKDREFSGRVFHFAQFANSTQYEDEVLDILGRKWPEKKQAQKISGIIERLKKGHSSLVTVKELEDFVSQHEGQKGSALSEALITSWSYYIYRHLDDSDRALKYLMKVSENLLNPESWAHIAYAVLYRQVAPNFKHAQVVYDAFAPYSHSRSWFPVERNTYNYTELYHQICTDNLLSEPDFARYTNLKHQWKNGNVTTEVALDRALALRKRNPNKADLLSFIGGLYVAQGKDQSAIPYYWQAHEACVYYNRSHWGLNNIYRRQRAKAFSDYDENLSQVDEALKDVEFSKTLSSYIVNWPSLSEVSKRRVKYALRYWAPYIDEIYASGGRVYIKQAYELLSESPSLEGVRDRRINYGTYSRDNRLWDDVRGLGGTVVVSDLGETRAAPFGAYNLAAHEVAHQFHHLASQEVESCIAKLYAAAKSRGQFPDPYAGSNPQEYFAQGVVYYLIPEGAPRRFGLNRKWLKDHDSDLLEFLKRIEEVDQVQDVTCPLP